VLLAGRETSAERCCHEKTAVIDRPTGEKVFDLQHLKIATEYPVALSRWAGSAGPTDVWQKTEMPDVWQETKMPDQIPMSQDQIADLIVKDVRRHAHCTGFKSIGVNRLAEGEVPGVNWSPAFANYGQADQRTCDAALREIIPRMQRQYRLI
jgi:hypothetical protein